MLDPVCLVRILLNLLKNGKLLSEEFIYSSFNSNTQLILVLELVDMIHIGWHILDFHLADTGYHCVCIGWCTLHPINRFTHIAHTARYVY